jgi:hydrogenase maturation protein HypF
VLRLLTHGTGTVCPLTSSMGRLFDAVAAIAGVRGRITYEGQPAIELEALARTVSRCPEAAYPVDVGWVDGGLLLDPVVTINAVRRDVDRGEPAHLVAARFHEAIGRSTVAAAVELARRHGLDTVTLSGGVFQNALLSEIVETGLWPEDLAVLVHSPAPPNDGGISVGQAAIAAMASMAEAEAPR